MGVDKVGLDCKLNLFPFDVLFPSASEPSFNFDNSKNGLLVYLLSEGV